MVVLAVVDRYRWKERAGRVDDWKTGVENVVSDKWCTDARVEGSEVAIVDNFSSVHE